MELEAERQYSIESGPDQDWGNFIQPPTNDNDTKETLERKAENRPVTIDIPSTIRIWVFIHRGKVIQNGSLSDVYDGTLRKLGHKRTSSGYVVSFVSEKDPSLMWRALLPREDGEHFITLYLAQ